MPLSNAQYDEIMHEYDERQLHNRHILETRRAEVLKKLPRLKEIDASVASSSVRQARLHLDGDTNALASLKQELSALSLERQQLLTASGYPADYLTRFIPVRIAKTAGISTGKNATVLNRQLSIPSMPSPTSAKYSVLKILTISATIFIRRRKKIR